ncbi:MAG: hypothetical protein HY961_18125 [Ignavibacteriae bacterium]|nr:hypothetical protein [Ignavibacteriota bacterium]
MKTVLLCLTLIFIAAASSYSQDRDSTGLPGDNFSLQGALEMFKKAGSPEEFEKLLNTQDNHVNNLDLNGDGDIDYVRVIDKMDKDVHAFVLQVPVSETENQDIAVVELEKTGDDNATVQIVGDEDIYGEQTIVEPDGGGDDSEEEGEGGNGPFAPTNYMSTVAPRIVVNVWVWPSVRYVYAPGYRVWVSPWRWRAYPVWWRPWRPFAWRVFHPFRARYHAGFAVVHTHRVVRAHRVYTPVRVSSVTVRTRHSASVTRYRTTRSATIKTKHGTTKVKTTRTQTRVKKGRR